MYNFGPALISLYVLYEITLQENQYFNCKYVFKTFTLSLALNMIIFFSAEINRRIGLVKLYVST